MYIGEATMEDSVDFLKKLKIESPYDPSIPLLDIYLEKTIIQIDTCTLMFIAALFAIARTWKQPRYPNKCMYNCCSERWYEMTTLNRLI